MARLSKKIMELTDGGNTSHFECGCQRDSRCRPLSSSRWMYYWMEAYERGVLSRTILVLPVVVGPIGLERPDGRNPQPLRPGTLTRPPWERRFSSFGLSPTSVHKHLLSHHQVMINSTPVMHSSICLEVSPVCRRQNCGNSRYA